MWKSNARVPETSQTRSADSRSPPHATPRTDSALRAHAAGDTTRAEGPRRPAFPPRRRPLAFHFPLRPFHLRLFHPRLQFIPFTPVVSVRRVMGFIPSSLFTLHNGLRLIRHLCSLSPLPARSPRARSRVCGPCVSLRVVEFRWREERWCEGAGCAWSRPPRWRVCLQRRERVNYHSR
ncbi:hypothetical protein B0H16DRAFT_1027406 [Mycena metata]|uniref:Uncharacterized protein n=1 Tax=Mycena metata TaxID=1033252 RepID=A0AAD7N221_9AGAR|nr:hypothetical protein B0H16DRAFT_1027406 [Mycena metata]